MTARPDFALDLHLDDLALFVRIVETGTLSAAARERNVPVSQVTRALARLEATCQARLLHRTTHSLSLTDEGDEVLATARRLLAHASDLHGRLALRRGGPSGRVRVSVSAVLAQAVVVPQLASLYERHPGLMVDVLADDRIVDMAREGIDVAVRTGEPRGEHLVARRIGTMTRSLYASPAYLARHGTPASPDELGAHRLLANLANPALNRWEAAGGAPAIDAGEHSATRTDNTAVVVAMALHGAGIGRISDFVARPLVRDGALVPVLPDHFRSEAVPMFAVMLQGRHRLPKVRALIDHLAQGLAAM